MERTDWLKLDANEGTCVLDAQQLARALSPEIARRYPKAATLENALAARLGLPPSRLIATAGADDAIERAFRVLAGPGSPVLTTVPGFVEFLDASARTNAPFVGVYRRPGNPFPLEEMLRKINDEAPGLVVLSTPDNPCGQMLSPEDFRMLAAACGRIGSTFLLDITYLDFAQDESILEEALATPGVLVTGSFSKSRGLAGFRAGWAASGDAGSTLIEKMREAGPPFSLSSPAIEAARIALSECEEKYRGFVAGIVRERQRLEALVNRLGWETWPQKANFVSLFVPDARSFVEELREQGILVRYWPGNKDAEGLVRITCPGNDAELARLETALERMAQKRTGGR
jgi:threonine-phosphate decarboxylase